MTGTGTQADPFVPYEWDEFTAAIGTSGAYVSMPIVPVKTTDTRIKLGKLYFDAQGNRITKPVASGLPNYYENNFKFDMNDIAPLGGLIEFNNCTVEGNGASIMNLYVPDDTKGIVITNGTLNFQNFQFLGINSESTNSNRGVFRCQDNSRNYSLTNVQFQGYIADGTFLDGAGGSTRKHISNTFSLTFGTNAKFCTTYINDTNKFYKNCWFDFYGTSSQPFTHNHGNRFIDCKMTGKLTGTAGENPLFPSDGSSMNCVIDMDVTEYSGVKFNYDNGRGQNPYIINTDKLPAGTTYVGIAGVTTAQLADAEYLQSIGFPVGD